MNPLDFFAYELLTIKILKNESIKQKVCYASAMSSRIEYYMPLNLLVHCANNENFLTCLILFNPLNSCLCKTCAHVTPAQFGPRLKCLRSKRGAQS